jgi:Ca-activated chloride channel homolog
MLRTMLLAAGSLLGVATPALAQAQQRVDFDIDVDVDVGEPLMIAGKPQVAYVKIGLTGFPLAGPAHRPPVNLAVVIDRSASMSGDRIEKAKQAALMVVDRLQDDDTISVVTFDSIVDVIVPAQRADERDHIRQRIAALTPRGSTALYAGMRAGIDEAARYLDHNRINRIILLSDGQANIGPSSPSELGTLGTAAAEQGITVTTIGLGLGYNEDLMVQLARMSDGNHAFAQTGDDLVRIFGNELGDVMSAVASDVEVTIDFTDGVVPIRALDRAAKIEGNRARVNLSQLYARQQKHVLFEVQVPASAANTARDVANVAVNYRNLVTRKLARASGKGHIAFTAAPELVARKQNKDVMVAAIEAIAAEKNRQAMALRDQGNVDAARQAFQANAEYMASNGAKLDSAKLKKEAAKPAAAAAKVDKPADWAQTRKAVTEDNYATESQRAWE